MKDTASVPSPEKEAYLGRKARARASAASLEGSCQQTAEKAAAPALSPSRARLFSKSKARAVRPGTEGPKQRVRAPLSVS